MLVSSAVSRRICFSEHTHCYELHLHTDGHFDKGKAFGNLSADISGMETANEELSVKQIMKAKTSRWKDGQLTVSRHQRSGNRQRTT